MKSFFKFASIPLALFGLLFGLPKMFQFLFNSHSDVGLLGILLVVCIMCGVISKFAYDFYMKEVNNDEA